MQFSAILLCSIKPRLPHPSVALIGGICGGVRASLPGPPCQGLAAVVLARPERCHGDSRAGMMASKAPRDCSVCIWAGQEEELPSRRNSLIISCRLPAVAEAAFWAAVRHCLHRACFSGTAAHTTTQPESHGSYVWLISGMWGACNWDIGYNFPSSQSFCSIWNYTVIFIKKYYCRQTNKQSLVVSWREVYSCFSLNWV